LVTQAIGVAVAFAWAFPVSLGIFLVLKYTIGLRVGKEEEMEGLDLSEHGMYAYPPSFVAGVPPSPAAAPAHLAVGNTVPAVQTG
jgi:Amt family ammonium transporter